MYQTLQVEERLYDALFRIDEERVEAVREAKCECGGALHSAPLLCAAW